MALVSIGAANHDPATFEQPTSRPSRAIPTPHLAFASERTSARSAARPARGAARVRGADAELPASHAGGRHAAVPAESGAGGARAPGRGRRSREARLGRPAAPLRELRGGRTWRRPTRRALPRARGSRALDHAVGAPQRADRRCGARTAPACRRPPACQASGIRSRMRRSSRASRPLVDAAAHARTTSALRNL